MKKLLSFTIFFTLLLSINILVSADSTPEYSFNLSIDGNNFKEVNKGDIITLALSIDRTDSEEPYIMYAMQDEIKYDDKFFEIVKGSEIIKNDVRTKDILLRDGYRSYYTNYLSLKGGTLWDKHTVIGSIQLKVKASYGSSDITSENCIVSNPDGSGSYKCSNNSVIVKVRTSSKPGTNDVGGKSDSDGDKDIEDQTDSEKEDVKFCNFIDVNEDDYFYNSVMWAVKKGITKGINVEEFAPKLSCTRAQMVTFLWRAAGSPETKVENNPFLDVYEDSYYYKAVMWAVKEGITKGITESNFGTEDTVSRAQSVVFLYRLSGQNIIEKNSIFEDVSNNQYYSDAVQWAVENSITNGTSNNTFSPKNNCDRGQIVTFLFRYYNKEND